MTDPATDFIRTAQQTYRAANAGTLDWMLARPRLHGAFINTKQNSMTLADYLPSKSWHGPDYTYGWIQGRALEAMVTHAAYFEAVDPALSRRLDAAGREHYAALKALYQRHGAAFFVYDADLRPVFRGADGNPAPQRTGTKFRSFADIFVIKGLIAAASRYALADRPYFLQRFADVLSAIDENRFIINEHQLLNEEAIARQRPDFGPRMIAMGAAAMLRRLGLTGEAAFGNRYIHYILERHLHRPSFLLRDSGDGDQSNVGHAIEFVGFAMDYLPADADRKTVETLHSILLASFDAGFVGPGICLHVSVASGQPGGDLCPWWSLPETIRAAALCWERFGDQDSLRIWQGAHEAFFTRYWRGEPAIAYQTMNSQGPIAFVPATPDLDPGYHTGLSLLGAIEVAARARAG